MVVRASMEMALVGSMPLSAGKGMPLGARQSMAVAPTGGMKVAGKQSMAAAALVGTMPLAVGESMRAAIKVSREGLTQVTAAGPQIAVAARAYSVEAWASMVGPWVGTAAAAAATLPQGILAEVAGDTWPASVAGTAAGVAQAEVQAEGTATRWMVPGQGRRREAGGARCLPCTFMAAWGPETAAAAHRVKPFGGRFCRAATQPTAATRMPMRGGGMRGPCTGGPGAQKVWHTRRSMSGSTRCRRS